MLYVVFLVGTTHNWPEEQPSEEGIGEAISIGVGERLDDKVSRGDSQIVGQQCNANWLFQTDVARATVSTKERDRAWSFVNNTPNSLGAEAYRRIASR